MGGYCAHFSYDTVRGFSWIGVFLFAYFSDEPLCHFGLSWPEVRPHCRSPPRSVSVAYPPNTRNGGIVMTTINLRNIYPWFKEDTFVEITDEMFEAMKAADRQQEAYQRRTYRYKAQFSLDCCDGMENAVLHHSPSPEELYINEETSRKLFSAIGRLTEVQRRRLSLYYFEGLTFRRIAEMEGGRAMQKTDRSVVRNEAYRKTAVGIRERHNERKNQEYSNPDIVTDRSYLNIHFKSCDGSYAETFDQMLADGTISTRSLQPDAKVIDELIFDVNTAYFDRNGGYEYAKEFFEEAYRLAIKETGGEQYILSAVMHADERNRALSEQLGRDVFHYHMHVVYIPIVDKEIKWSKRCKDPTLVGTTKEIIKQVSHSKKWPKLKRLDENGEPVLSRNGKPVLVNSYSLLQDRFFEHMQAAGYTDFERGERGSTAEHLNVLDYKIQQEEARADTLTQSVEKKQAQLSGLQEKITVTKQTAATFSEISGMTKKTIGGNVQLSPVDWKTVSGLAKKGVTADSEIADLKKELTAARKDAQIYKSRWERLMKETKLFREAVKHAPRLVKDFLDSVFRKPPEKEEAERPINRKSKDVER